MKKSKILDYLGLMIILLFIVSCQHNNFNNIILSKEYIVKDSDTICVRWINRDSVPFGLFYVYGQDNRISSINCYNENGNSEGVAITYYANGKTNSLRSLMNSVPDGPVIYFHPNGNINSYINYKKGFKVGPGFRYNEAGVLTDYVVYDDFGSSFFAIQYLSDSIFISGDPIGNIIKIESIPEIKIDSGFVATNIHVPRPPGLEVKILYKWDNEDMVNDYVSLNENSVDSLGQLIFPIPEEFDENKLFLILTYSKRGIILKEYSYSSIGSVILK